MYNFFKKSYLNSYLTSTVIRIAICHLTNAIKFILSFVHIHFLILYLNIYKLEYKINPKSYIDHIIIIFSSTVSKTSWENLIHNKNWIIFEIQYYNINAWKICLICFSFEGWTEVGGGIHDRWNGPTNFWKYYIFWITICPLALCYYFDFRTHWTKKDIF